MREGGGAGLPAHRPPPRGLCSRHDHPNSAFLRGPLRGGGPPGGRHGEGRGGAAMAWAGGKKGGEHLIFLD